MAEALESDLCAPVKAHLEAAGFAVRSEVRRCDLVAVRPEGGGECVLAVELKLEFGLPVLYQAIARLGAADLACVAVGVPAGARARAAWDARLPDAVRLCRMLGIGLLSVRDGIVRVEAEPGPYQSRKQPRARARLLAEFRGRSGDHNLGGSSNTRGPRVTAYREAALRVADLLSGRGPMRAAAAGRELGLPKAASILQRDVYGWFTKVAPGTYALAPTGREALVRWATVVEAQRAAPPPPADPARPALRRGRGAGKTRARRVGRGAESGPAARA